jgi:hypothetical protein
LEAARFANGFESMFVSIPTALVATALDPSLGLLEILLAAGEMVPTETAVSDCPVFAPDSAVGTGGWLPARFGGVEPGVTLGVAIRSEALALADEVAEGFNGEGGVRVVSSPGDRPAFALGLGRLDGRLGNCPWTSAASNMLIAVQLIKNLRNMARVPVQ